jgi:murein L,D-transpeptidase YafK
MARLRDRRELAAGVMTLFAVSLIGLTAGAIAPGAGKQRGGNQAVLFLSSPRVVVLKAKRSLHLFDGEVLVRSYSIDLGTDPSGPKLRQGDGQTPTGVFRVVTKNAASCYHRFLGLDYPNAEAVERGLRQGLLSPGEASSIRDALAGGRCPDWSTALGGGIGIHGHRRGSDWTAGCIALADEHVEELFSVLRIGDPVEILP